MERITLAHGNGGRFMKALIEEVFVRHLGSAGEGPDVRLDAAPIELDGGTPLMTTDGFIVQPLEFPGGDIGSLAVHGTVNDLAVAGARPRYLTLNAFIEEGLEIRVLDRIVASLARAGREAGVRIVAGDTKVLPRGQGGGLYLATTGVGLKPAGLDLGMHRIRAGDRVVVSGPVGDHGVTVLLARDDFDIEGDLQSDSAPVITLAEAAIAVGGLRFMRDPTRGGLAGVACELAEHTGMSVHLDEARIPVRDPVAMLCDMLGYDPLYLACEGRIVAVVSPDSADALIAAWRSLDGGHGAREIGRVEPGPSRVTLHTELGGERLMEELEDDPLPRIC